MGHYLIEIEGFGAHHNVAYEGDADRIAAELVARLKAKGHNVARADFVSLGSIDDLLVQPKEEAEDGKAQAG